MGDEIVSPVAHGGTASVPRQGLDVGWAPRAHQSGALDAMFPFAKLRWAGAAHPTRLVLSVTREFAEGAWVVEFGKTSQPAHWAQP
ncbi:MAG: hypothetical protein EAZ30_06330 [Betaproteobacteria bacterium]|nr:MAG: hypothetical protein EAZ30_06330 [Betaproteobacteria bacterium]